MTISIPTDFAFQDSNITDPTDTIRDLEYGCHPPVFDIEKEVQGDLWVWEYRGKTDYVVPRWNQHDADRGVYEIGDILFKDCKTIKITGKKGAGIFEKRRPKEPEEYSGWDEPVGDIVDYTKFKHRYFRIPSTTNGGFKALSRCYRTPSGISHYNMLWDTCGIYGCGGKGFWVWYAHPYPFNRSINSCIKGYSHKYDSAKDVKATFGNCWGEDVIRFHSMIERKGFFYFRTHLNKPLEYATWMVGTATQYTYSVVESPGDIPGFIKKRMVQQLAPFDGKNYTRCKAIPPDGVATWTVVAQAEFDTIAFGHILADWITLTVYDPATNKELSKITRYPIDNRLAANSKMEYNTTVILYTPRDPDTGKSVLMPAGAIVKIEIGAEWEMELGEIISGEALDAGFTKPVFSNKIKDLSPKEQDQWGYWEYKEGAKVLVHSGTVDFPVMSYNDYTRLMRMIGGGRVIINSSDSIGNEYPDSRKVFTATMLIARFINLSLSTKEKNKKIGDIANYDFNIEELI